MRDGRRITQWEFWPYWAFYLPVYLHLVAAAIRSGRFGQFICANPGIPFGGLLEYSKQDLMAGFPARLVPRTVVAPGDVLFENALRMARDAGLSFPIIVKPDRGERGFFVEKIDAESGLRSYLDRYRRFLVALGARGLDPARERLLIQEYVGFREEFGVMWMRHPDWKRGRITSIVQKRLLSVVGDGDRDLASLIRDHARACFHESMLRERYADRLDETIPKGEEVFLVEIGNHSRGATFLNATAHADEQLAGLFAPLAASIPGFHVGRFDVRAPSIEALRAGEFRVIEVNGVNSEPAHIYDPANRLRAAYGDLLAHWRLVEQIAGANRATGCTPPSFRELFRAVRVHAARIGASRELDRDDSDET